MTQAGSEAGTNSRLRRVLLCGHRSFAARGLEETLRAAGWDVICFTRGPVQRSGNVVTGPADQIDSNPHLEGSFDAVVNFIMLKDESIERNIALAQAMLRFVSLRGVRHLLHVSSISSFEAGASHLTEQTPTEPTPEKKGAYGGPKTATDLHLLQNRPPELSLTLLRPGFILGRGVVNPIVGTGARLPWNKLLVIGNGHSILPMTSRQMTHQAILRALDATPAPSTSVLMLAAPNSPTKRRFLDACCRRLGAGKGVVALPVAVWWCIAVAAECAARVLGQAKLKPYSKLVARLARQTFDASQTARQLDLDLTVDWESELAASMDAQLPNFELPYSPTKPPPPGVEGVSFIGFGRIVRQKHLPALRKLQFKGSIRAYDLASGAEADGIRVEPVENASLDKRHAFIVATPGPAHVKAIPLLQSVDGPILVEKPLAMDLEELDQWQRFAAQRTAPVLVCHNYRYKLNVERMLQTLQAFNPGKLEHVSLVFQSPPAVNDSAVWLRDERRARTLLMDYSIHFLDLACMFGLTPWKVDHLRHELDQRGHTRLIEGHLSGDYSAQFVLKQGFFPRRARLRFVFRNYSVSLGFFPETFAVQMSDDNPWLYKQEARASMRATIRKVADRLLNRDSDLAHINVIADLLAGGNSYTQTLRVERLANFYRTLFEIGDRVYEPAVSSQSSR